MRRLLFLLPVVAAVLAIPTAEAVRGPAVSLSVSSFQVRYGDATHLSGRVSNHRAGVSVGVFARAFTGSGFSRIATVMSGAGGWWAHDAKPTIATTYQARTDGRESRTLLVGVRPAVSLQRLDGGKLRVVVMPTKPFVSKFVKFQRSQSGTWSTIAPLRLNAKSQAPVPPRLVPLTKSVLRVTMSVNQAGPGYLGGFSPPVVMPARWVSLTLSTSEIVYGKPLVLSGRVSPKRAGVSLTILRRGAAKPEFEPLATLTTAAGGRWSYRAHPRVGTAYEAQSLGATSRILGVGVHPKVTSRIASRGRVAAHVAASLPLAARVVQVQQLVEGQWKTVAKAMLNGRSDAIFAASKLPGGTSTLRIAMSVNQAGTGYLGAFGRPFVYQR